MTYSRGNTGVGATVLDIIRLGERISELEERLEILEKKPKRKPKRKPKK